MNPQQLQQQVQQLQNELNTLKAQFAVHQHDGIDGTNPLRKALTIDVDQVNGIGLSNHASTLFPEQAQYQYAISVGEGYRNKNFANRSNDLQLTFIHNKSLASTSNINAMRGPIISAGDLSVTSGGSTVTINGFNFTTNELAGAYINIYNSSGTMVENKTIASNTSTVVTITGTWGASTSSATCLIYKPVLLGSSDRIFSRLYVEESVESPANVLSGGIRFGVGNTGENGSASTNGLLYMDATGDLYWRNKSGTSTKLN